MCVCLAEFKLPSPTNETMIVCGQTLEHVHVYTIKAEDIQAALGQLTQSCTSAVLRIQEGVGVLSRPAQISNSGCGKQGLSISLVGELSFTSAGVPSTRLKLQGNHIGINNATVCMQGIVLQDGVGASGVCWDGLGRVRACVHACVCAHACVHMRARVHMRACVHMGACTWVRAHACVQACVHDCICVCVKPESVHQVAPSQF